MVEEKYKNNSLCVCDYYARTNHVLEYSQGYQLLVLTDSQVLQVNSGRYAGCYTCVILELIDVLISCAKCKCMPIFVLV